MLSLVKKDERRRKGRVHCQMLHCSLGVIVNLSGSGVCVQRRGLRVVQKGDVVDMTLVCHEGELRVKGRVSWLNRSGFMQHQAGVDFVDVTKEQEKTLASFARASMSDSALRQAV